MNRWVDACVAHVRHIQHPLVLLALITTLTFALPFIKFVIFSLDMFTNINPILDILFDAHILKAFLNSLAIGVGTTLLGGGIGLTLALFLGLSDTHRMHIWSFLVFLIFFLPPSFLAIAWIDTGILMNHWLGVDNPMYTKTATVILLSIHLFPIAFFMVLDQLKRIPFAMIEAGKISHATQPYLLRTIILPLLRPVFIKSLMMLWIACLGHFTLFALLGIPGQFSTLTTLIYSKLTGFGIRKMDVLAILSLLLILLGSVGLCVLRSLQKPLPRYAATSKQLTHNTFNSVLTRRIVYGLFAVICMSIILPMIKLLMTSLTPRSMVTFSLAHLSFENYAYILTYPTSLKAFSNSLSLALSTSLLLYAQSALFEYGALMTRHRIFKHARFFFQVFYLIPGSILGIGLILLFLNPFSWMAFLKLHVLYSSLFMIGAAYIIRFCAFHLNIAHAGRGRFSAKLLESARICGARSPQIFKTIFLPLMTPSLLNGSILVFILIMHEVTISALLPSSDTQTIGVLLLSMMEHGDTKGTAALCILVTVFLVMFRALAHTFTQKTLHRVYQEDRL